MAPIQPVSGGLQGNERTSHYETRERVELSFLRRDDDRRTWSASIDFVMVKGCDRGHGNWPPYGGPIVGELSTLAHFEGQQEVSRELT